MATGTDDDFELTFEEVDWEQEQARGLINASFQFVGQVVVNGLILLGLVWDYFILANQDPTIEGFHYPGLGGNTIVTLKFWELRRPVLEFTANGVDLTTTLSVWDVTSVEWLLMLVLTFGFFNVAIPLYENRRMTMYYWQQFRKNKAAVASLVFLIATFLVGFIGPMFLPAPELSLTEQFLPPMGVTAQPPGYAEPVAGTMEHPLGTDQQGRDMLKLVVFGMRVSMEVGLLSMAVAIGIGAVVGATAAHAGGLVDEVLMRYVDIQSTFPSFLLLLLLVYLFGGSLILIIGLFGFFGWEGVARQVRSEALQKNEEAYIQAAEAAGASQWWIVRRHIIPNTSSTIVTAATLAIPGFVLGEATLSFLGFADPEIFSWGQTIAGGRGNLRNAPWISTLPGFFLFFTVLGFNFLGDALRDSIDPRQEKE